MNRPALKRLAALASLFVLSLLSCGREVTGPDNGVPYGRSRIAALALDPQLPSLFASLSGASDAVPFENVRVVLRRENGTIVLDTLIAFPADADSISVTVTVPIPIDAPEAGLPLSLTMAYVNAQGDTVFRGGPTAVVAAPLGSPGASTPVTIPITFDGIGKDAVSVVITPDTGTVVAGTTSTFSAAARNAAQDAIVGTPIFYYTLDSTRAHVPNAAVGSVTWLANRGVARIVAAHPNGQPSDTAYVTVALPASKLAIGSGNEQSGTANVALAQPLVVRTLASDDVPVEGVEVTFAVATGGGSLAVLVDTSDVDGNVEIAWTLGADVGPQTITATAAGLAGSPLTLMATATAGVPAQVAILSQPAGAVAGVAMTPSLVVAVQDSAGNTVTSFTGNVSIALPAGSNATLGGTTVRATVAGIATFDDLSIDRADSHTLIASSDALDADTANAVVITPAAAASLAFVQQPPPATAGVAIAPAITVIARDAFGNLATDFTGDVSVALCICVPGATLSGTTTVAAVAGEASFGTLSVNKAAAGYRLEASSAGLVADTSDTFEIVAGAAALLLKEAGDAQVGIAGSTLADSLVVLVVDGQSNPVSGVPVAFAAQNGGSVSPASVVTNADGLARAAWTLGASPGAQVVNVTSGALAGIAFDAEAEAGAATQLAILVPSPVSLTAGVATSDVLISATDSLGNMDPSFSGTVTVSIVSGPPGGSITDGGGSVVAEEGVATFPGLTFERAGTYVLRFTASGLTAVDHEGLVVGNAGAQVVNFAGGDLQTGVVGTVLADSLAVVVTDNFGNPIADHPVTWHALAGGGSVSPAVTTTDEQGRAATAWTLGAALGEQVAEATAGAVGALQFSATATAGAAANIAMGTPSGDGQSGDINTTLPLPLTVKVTDAGGNPVEGTLVTWTVVSGSADVTLGAVTTDSLGISATELVLHDSVSTITVHATVDGLVGSPVVFTATINQFAVRLQVVNEPAASTAGVALSAFAVGAHDSEGAIDPNFTGPVTVSVDSGPALATLLGTTSVTAVGGVATFDAVVAQVAGEYRLRFAAGGLSDTISANFTVVAGAPFAVAVYDGQAQTDTVDAVLPLPLRVKVTDEFGNAAPGAPVAWAITLGSGVLGADTTLSGADGFAAVQLTLGDTPGPVTVQASADGLTGSPVNFGASILPGNATHLAVTAAPDTVDGGVPASTFVVEARDRHDNIVTGFSGDVTVTPTDAPDDDFAAGTTTQPLMAGVATFDDLVFGTLGSWIITFATDGLPTVNADVEVVVGAVSTFEKVSGDAQSGMATQALDSALVVRVLDAGGNAVVGDTVFFTVTSGGGTLGNGFAVDTALVDANGLAGTTWTLGSALGGQTVEAVTSGTPTLEFNATAITMIANRTWTGDVNTSLTEPGNWKNSLVPSSSDSVLVPAGRPNYPALTASMTVSRLTIENGASLALGNQTLAVNGSLAAPTSIAISAGLEGVVIAQGALGGTVRGRFPRLAFQNGTYLATGQLTSGDLSIELGASLDVATHQILVEGYLVTLTGGTLEMNDGANVEVMGNATFSGGSTAGYLTGGTLRVHGDVNVGGDAQAFNAAAAHTLVLAGSGTQSILFANPDTLLTATCAQSCLGTLAVDKQPGDGGVVFSSGAKALGSFQLSNVDSATAVGGRLISVLPSNFTGTPTALAVFASQTAFTRGASFTADTLVNWSPNGALPAGETIPTIVAGEVTLDVDFAPPLIVEGVLSVGNAQYTLGSTLETRGNGRLALGNLEDTLVVTGTATFRGKDADAGLSVGVLELGDGLVIDGAPGAPSFVAHAGLIIRFTSPTAFAQIANPSENPLGSLHVAEGAQLEFANSSAMILGDVVFEGTTGLVNGGDGGAILILGNLTDTIGGRWSHSSTFMGGSGATLNARSVDGNLTVNGSVTLGGAVGDSTVVNGDFVVSGATGMLTMGGGKLIAQSFATESGGRVAMTANTDTVQSLGDVRFAGGASTLTAGYLEVRGNFIQDTDPGAFVAEPAHSTWFRGASPQTISFANPGFAGNGSAFGELYHAKTPGSQLTLLTDVYASGMLETGIATGYQIAGGGQLLTTRGADVNLLHFINVRWDLLDGAPIGKLDTITFGSMDPEVVQWRIARQSGTHLVRRPVFTSAPTSGKYLEVIDANGGGDLEITLEDPNPSQPSGGLSVLNGAIVNGWDQVLLTWGGTVDDNWSNPANWVEAIIPTAADSVYVPAVAPNAPTLPDGITLRALVSDLRFVSLAGSVGITGTLNVHADSGLVCSSNSVFLGTSGDTATIGGQFIGGCTLSMAAGVVRPMADVSWDGSVALQAQGVLDVGAYTFHVVDGPVGNGGLQVFGGGTLRMTDAAGVLRVDGPAQFLSTSTQELTAGTLEIGGHFVQQSPGTFAASGTHHTILQGDGAPTLTIDNPTNAVAFNDLTVLGPRQVTQEGVYVNGNLALDSVAVLLAGSGSPIRVAGNVTVGENAQFSAQFLEVGGTLAVDNVLGISTVTFTGNDQVIPTNLMLPNVIVSGNARLSGGVDSVTVTGGLTVSGELWLGHPDSVTRVHVEGNFQTVDSGTLRMMDDATTLVVMGDAAFDGGSTAGKLTNGRIDLYGNFAQGATGDSTAFSASAPHVTWLRRQGANSAVAFASPGAGSTASHFGDLYLAADLEYQVILHSDAWIEGRLRTGIALAHHLTGADAPRTVVSQGANVDALVFSNVRWVLQPGAPIEQLDGVSFTDMDPNVVQLDIRREDGSVAMNGLQFLTTPESGKYLRVEDVNGSDNFGVVVTNISPSFYATYVELVNGATLSGWNAFPDFTWTGNYDADFANPANWMSGVVPTAADSAYIPASAESVPFITSPTTLRALVSDREGEAILLGDSLIVTQRLLVPSTGSALSCDGGLVVLGGSAPAEVRGNIHCPAFVVGSDTITAVGTTEFGSLDITSGAFQVGASTVLVHNNLTTSESGRLRMGHADGLMTVNGSAAFGGASTDGMIRLGRLRVQGDFTATQPGAFVGSFPHTTELFSEFVEGTQSVSFSNPGNQRFAALVIDGGSKRLTTDAFAIGNVAVRESAELLGEPGVRLELINGTSAFAAEPLSVLDVDVLVVPGATTFDGVLQVDTVVFNGVTQTVPAYRADGNSITYASIRVTSDTRFFPDTGALYTLSGSLIASDTAIIRIGGAGHLTYVEVGGDLVTTGAGRLAMQDTNTTLHVSGNATFSGGSTDGLLTNGRLVLRGDFTQAGGSDEAFLAAAPHTTVFQGDANQAVSFANPGLGAASSHFGDVELGGIEGGTEIQLGSPVYLNGSLRIDSLAAGRTLWSSAGRMVTSYGGRVKGGLTFNNVHWTILNGQPLDTLEGLTFTNIAADTVQLRIVREQGAVHLISPTFSTAGSNAYFRAEDFAGGGSPDLTIEVSNPQPTFHGGRAQAVGGFATIDGWPADIEFRWIGDYDDNWNNPLNWSMDTLPAADDTVYIGAAAQVAPTITSDTVTIGGLYFEIDSLPLRLMGEGAWLVLAGGGTIHAPTTNIGVYCDSTAATEGILLDGAGSYGVRGRFACNVTANAGIAIVGDAMRVDGDLTVRNDFRLGSPSQVDVMGRFDVLDNGRVEMTAPGDRLEVQGRVRFLGTNQSTLTAGELRVHENFEQGNSNDNLRASDDHLTVFLPPDPMYDGVPRINFVAADTSETYLNHVQFDASRELETAVVARGNVSINGEVTVYGDGRLEVYGALGGAQTAALEVSELWLDGAFNFPGSKANMGFIRFIGEDQEIPFMVGSTPVTYPSVVVTGTASMRGLGGTIEGLISVEGGGELRIGGPDTTTTITVSDFFVSGGGTIRMVDAATTVTVLAGIAFDGGGRADGKLTDGVLRGHAGFYATDTSFMASGNHRVELIDPCDPVCVPNRAIVMIGDSARFNDLFLDGSYQSAFGLRARNLELGSSAELTNSDESPLTVTDDLIGGAETYLGFHTLRLGGANLFDGSLDIANLTLDGANQQLRARDVGGSEITYHSVRIEGSAQTLIEHNDSLVVNGGFFVSGTGSMRFGHHPDTVNTIVIAEGLFVEDSGTVTMQDSLTTVRLLTGALFNGGSTAGLLTAGTIETHGNFRQAGDNSTESYAAGPMHRTRVVTHDGVDPLELQFDNPGTGAGASSFGRLELLPHMSGHIAVRSDLTVAGSLIASGPYAVDLRAPESEYYRITSHGASAANVHFRRVAWTLAGNEVTGSIGAMINLMFEAQDATGTQFRIARPSGNLLISGLQFETQPTSGRYLEVEDTNTGDAEALEVTVVEVSPGSHGSYVVTLGGAVLNGWDEFLVHEFSGGVASDPNNWPYSFVPGPNDSVYVTSAGTMIVDVPLRFRSLVAASGAQITLSDSLTVSKSLNLADAGNVTCEAGGALFVRGNGDASVVSVSESCNLRIDSASTARLVGYSEFADVRVAGSASLRINGSGLEVHGVFETAQSGTLRMIDEGDLLSIGDSAVFAGGSTDGLLTTGSMILYGDLVVAGSTPTALVTGPDLTVRLGAPEGGGEDTRTVYFGHDTLSYISSLRHNDGTTTLLSILPVRNQLYMNANEQNAIVGGTGAWLKIGFNDGVTSGELAAEPNAEITVPRIAIYGGFTTGTTFNVDTVDFLGAGSDLDGSQTIPRTNVANGAIEYGLLRTFGPTVVMNQASEDGYSIGAGLHVLGGNLNIGLWTSPVVVRADTAGILVSGPTASLTITGSGAEVYADTARFESGTTSVLTDSARLIVGGAFVQKSAGSFENAFQATVGGTVVMRDSSFIHFDDPSESYFDVLRFQHGAKVTLSSDVTANGVIGRVDPYDGTVSVRSDLLTAGNSRRIYGFGGFDASASASNAITFRNVGLELTAAYPAPFDINRLTFTELDPTVVALKLSLSGYSPLTFNQINFSYAVTSGRYVEIEGALVGFTNSSPLVGCIAEVCGDGDTAPWDDEGPNVWTGGDNSSWDEPDNWLLPNVPDAYTDVIIGTSDNPPVIPSGAREVRNLTIQDGGLLTFAGTDTLIVRGTLLSEGDVAGSGGVLLMRPADSVGFTSTGQFAPKLAIANGYGFASGVVALDGNSSVGGNVEVGGSAQLNLRHFALHIAGNFNTVDGDAFGGRLAMTDNFAVLDVAGNVGFGGGSTDGLLTDGNILVGGSFTQSSFNLRAFHATGDHTVEFVGGGTSVVTFSNPGADSSRFQNVRFDKTSGGIVRFQGSNAYLNYLLAWNNNIEITGTSTLTVLGFILGTGSGSYHANISSAAVMNIPGLGCTEATVTVVGDGTFWPPICKAP